MFCTVHRGNRTQLTRPVYAINQKTNKTTGEHLRQKEHRVSDMTVTILEKIFRSDPVIRKERERYFIVKMNTKLD